MANEINGWGTFVLTAGSAFDVIDFQPGELIADDAIRTTTNSNGTASGGVHSDEPSQFFAVGDNTITVAYDVDTYAAVMAEINVKDTGTLTSKSGKTISGLGWIKSYSPDTNTPSDRPTATLVWHNYTGASGETLPTIT